MATDFKYLIFNAPSAATIDRAASLGCNWAIVHSAGIEEGLVDAASGRPMDAFPLYFDDYPKVASYRRHHDSVWLEPLRHEVTALCERADSQGLAVAFHMYEPTLPHVFEREYPETVGVYRRPTQAGTQYVHSHLDPDDPDTWKLVRSKYAELAREFPLMRMVILTTWDGAGSRWCIPDAKMPRAERLVRMIEEAKAGVDSVREGVTVVFRLWGRNWPREMYTESHSEIARITGVENADELMDPTVRAYNDPEVILPQVFDALPADVPVMYKSTQIDIADGQPIAACVGKYPVDREQIIEVSYEQYHKKPWPWCKVAHIRSGLAAAREHGLAGVLALPVNMGNNDRASEPERGNLGRMNTWMLGELLADASATDAELVARWLEREYGSPQPAEAARALLEADGIVDKSLQWGGGVPSRAPFASLHSTKLYWLFDGYIDPEFPKRMADPTLDDIEALIETKRQASEDARRNIGKLRAARAAMAPELYDELTCAYGTLADYAILCRDWHSYLLVQYAVERGLLESSRVNLGRMSRYCESFITGLLRLSGTEAGKLAQRRISFPDPFDLT